MEGGQGGVDTGFSEFRKGGKNCGRGGGGIMGIQNGRGAGAKLPFGPLPPLFKNGTALIISYATK